MTGKEFLAWKHKAVTLLGMSGVGKTTLAASLPRNKWFHYSGDYRIGTKYLAEPILDNIKRQAMQVGFLRDLLRSDSIYIASNITVDNLAPIATFLGKIGRRDLGGLPVEEFKRRQRLHREAEIGAMCDVAAFIDKAHTIYGYDHFLNDAGGSIVELDDEATIETLARHTLILYLKPDRAIEQRIATADFIVVDFERVSEVDASGARVMLQAADHVKRAGKALLLAGLVPKDPRTRMIREMDVHKRLADANFFPDIDRALESAEDRLLAALRPGAAVRAALTLDETLMGDGLDAAERRVLAGMLVERQLRKGEAVFRSGEPGDAMYVLLQGQIGIWMPPKGGGDTLAEGRRLVSYAPGVVFGEMGLLAGAARSADAIAETDAVVLELERSRYERLTADHPAVLGKLLLNINVLLASRVRALSDELQAAQGAR